MVKTIRNLIYPFIPARLSGFSYKKNKNFGIKMIFISVLIIVDLGVGRLALAQTVFTHPGLLNNQVELDLIKARVAARTEPWYSGYQKIPDYRSYVPTAVADYCWDSTPQDTHIWEDARAAYGSALRWLITNDASYARKSVEIMNDWSYTLQTFSYCDSARHTSLAIEGGFPQMIWAAEIIRATYTSWSQTDKDRFKNFLINKVYPNTTFISRTTSECVSSGGNNNWGAMGAETRMAIAIYADRRDYFDEAVMDYKFLNDKTFRSSGKYLETCRCTTNNGCSNTTGCSNSQCISCNSTGGGDLEHTQMTLTAMTAMAEIAKKQGVDLYGYADPLSGNSLLTTLEYHAPFIGYPARGSATNWPCLVALESAVGQETSASTRKRSFYEIAYNHYRPSSLASIVTGFKRPEGNIGWADIGWGTLTHAYSGAQNTPPAIPTGVRVI